MNYCLRCFSSFRFTKNASLIFQADLRVGRRVSSSIFQKTLELELGRDTADVDALAALLPSAAPQRVGSGSLALGTATATAAASPLHRLPSGTATVATSSAATGAALSPFGFGRRSETFQSDDLRWDRNVSAESDSGRVRLVVDDLALAPKTNGVRPVLEFLRQLLETGLGRARHMPSTVVIDI